MQREAFRILLEKGRIQEEEIGAVFAGDLLNQCVGSAYGLLSFSVPYFGLYGACSTAAEGLLLSSMAVGGGYFDYAAAITSSHYCSAERQYRTPLEYGAQRAPTAQWTVTGSGAFLVGKEPTQGESAFSHVRIAGGMPGIVIEKGIKDAANMGAAMMPAVLSTLKRWFSATGSEPCDYDLILTGDLGNEGGKLLETFLAIECGYRNCRNLDDCGKRIYRDGEQDTHAGGSGCGASAVVLAADILPRLERGDLRRVLLIGSGAMMSPASLQQGEAIPGIGHLVYLESR